MHATVHSGGRSLKPNNDPTQLSQLKTGSDNVQTSMPIPSQAKGRKRERADHGSELFKRERSSKADDCDSAQFKSESILKFEISSITEKGGGLVNSEGVEKLVQLMQPNRVEKKLELVSRLMFASVIVATENFDCLSRFVQLKGLPVLDQWLQDVHKGKVRDGSPKDGDKSMEEFLFVMLRALDKLPVNLHALQMCNIGKSVNHLRTYKNAEIQKKARSLVDTWKKRVEAEMNVDTKSGSNQAVYAIKSPEQSSSAKIASSKPDQAEIRTKLATSSSGPINVVPLVKDGQPRSVVGSNPDLIPSTTNRDERSSSSTQSHNNSQSGSSDHAKTTGFSGKEDARSSTGGSSRPRRSANGHPGSAPSGSPRETGSSRNFTLPKDLASGKVSQSGLTCEKALDISMTEGSSHKLIVKIPNRGRSPAQNTNVGPVENPTVMNSRASSPGISEKNDQSDPDSQEKADDVKTTSDVKTESWESNDFKDILTGSGSDEGEGSPCAIHEGARNGDEDAKLVETSKVVSNSVENELNPVSFSSIDALIESCVKFASISGGDDGGMDLLATVAAGEMSKSDLPSPDVSSGRTRDIRDDCKSSAPDGNDLVSEQCQSEDVFHGTPKQRNPISLTPQKATEEDAHDSFKLDSKTAVNLCPQINDRSDKIMDIASISTSPTSAAGKVLISDISKQLDEKIETKIKDTKLMENILAVDVKLDNVASRLMVKKETFVGGTPIVSSDADSENKVDMREACNNGSYANQKPSLEAKAGVGECNDTSKDFSSKSVDKHDGVKLEDNEGCGGKMTCDEADESKESESSTSHVNKKPKFDLNEGFGADDGKIGYCVNNLGDTGFPVFAHRVNPLPFPVAAAKGPFVPPMDLLKNKRELGWKGSAATSAFRPAEPRKTLETPPVTKHSRPLLDFDLNVTDERIVDDVTSRNSVHETASTSAHAAVHDFSLNKRPVPPPLPFPVGLDFDLNRVDEAGDTWMGSASSCHGSEVPFFPSKLSPSGGYTISESKMDFDLNDGPVVDEPVEPSLHNHHSRNYMQSQPFSSWFPAGNPSVTIPSILSDRGDQIHPFPIVTANGPARVLGPATGPIPFPPELYRGSVLSSSPAVPFPSFQYPVFPFGTGFSVPSATPSVVSNTYTDSISNGRLGFAASNSHYPRPYVVSLTDGTNSMSVGNTSKWARQGLDLNAGPGTVEMEARDDSSSLVSRQLSVASSQALADEQGRMFQQMTSVFLNRKENTENFRYKQSSWQ